MSSKQALINEFRGLAEKTESDRAGGLETVVRKVEVPASARRLSRAHRGIELVDDPASPRINTLDPPRDLAEAGRYLVRLDAMIADEPSVLAELAAALHAMQIELGSINEHHPDSGNLRAKHDTEIGRLRMAAARIDDAKALRYVVWQEFPALDPRPRVERPKAPAPRRAFKFITRIRA